MFVSEVTENARRNRTPIIVWSCIIIAPALVIGIAFAVWLAFGGKQSLMADNAAQLPASVTDRTWSFYQAFDCIQSRCSDVTAAKAFIQSGSTDALTITDSAKRSTYTIAALDDDQWLQLSNAITRNGSMPVSDVVAAVKDGGTNSGVFTVGSTSEAFTFSSGKTSSLMAIEIGSM